MINPTIEDAMELPSDQRVANHLASRILYVDAYDSFSYNVVSMLEENLGLQVTIITVDAEWPDQNMKEFLRRFDAVVLGPGPGDPNIESDVGIMKDLLNLDDDSIVPVLGICLGFQLLCLQHGIPIRRLCEPLHGQVCRITTTEKDILKGLGEFEVTLYHSLFASLESLTAASLKDNAYGELEILAWLLREPSHSTNSTSSTLIPMAARHRKKPFWGFQFHPESCKSNRVACVKLLQNWWSAAQSFNRNTRRVIRVPEAQPTVAPRIAPFGSEINAFLDDLTANSSDRCASRELYVGLGAERIFEAVNTPGTPSVLFQSNGRYAVISTPCPGTSSWRLEYYMPNGRLLLPSLPKPFEVRLESGQVWDLLRYIMEKRKVYSGNDSVPFWGGFLGYFSYEMGLSGLAHPRTSKSKVLEKGNESNHTSYPSTDNKHGSPDISLLWVERSIVVDKESRKVYIQSTRQDDDLPGGWLDMTYQCLQNLSTLRSCRRSTSHKIRGVGDIDNQRLLAAAETELLSWIFDGVEIDYPKEDIYKSQIEACKSELARGESYELCLTCETTVKLPLLQDGNIQKLRPWLLYKKLQVYNPAAFSAFVTLGNVRVVSSSPECFINWDRDSMLEMKPMKGTVKKSEDMTLEKAKVILGSTKEMAENLMIADLIRHDLYGICGSGNVHVEKLLEVEDHGRVYQMITHVKGIVNNQQLQPRRSSMHNGSDFNMSFHGLTALERCLPPGSMTGAPKERSCMHLQAIENRKRGIYSGVMGFLDLGGGGSFSVMIRTLFSDSPSHADATEEIWRIGAGGAVTILSTADGEWDEMMTKLRTVLNIFNSSN